MDFFYFPNQKLLMLKLCQKIFSSTNIVSKVYKYHYLKLCKITVQNFHLSSVVWINIHHIERFSKTFRSLVERKNVISKSLVKVLCYVVECKLWAHICWLIDFAPSSPGELTWFISHVYQRLCWAEWLQQRITLIQ